jgi:hypothetical protein
MMWGAADQVARIDPREGGGKCGPAAPDVAEPVFGPAEGETRGLRPGYAR